MAGNSTSWTDKSEDTTDFVTPQLPGYSPKQKRRTKPTNALQLGIIPENGENEAFIVPTETPKIEYSPGPIEFTALEAVSRYSRSSSRYSRQSSVTGDLRSIVDEDCRCGDYVLTSWDCLYTNDEDLIWSPKDICSDDQNTYRKILLRDVVHNDRQLTQEIQHVCRMNFVNRLEVICEVLMENNISLDSDALVGEMSETPLHVALMYESTEAAKLLIKYGGADLILKKYTKSAYHGTTALHKAITKRNREIIQEMLENLNAEQRNQILHDQASGDYVRGKYLKTGLPLSLAALIGDKDILDDLVRYGAQVDAVDEHTGNNIIHSLVMFSKHRSESSQEMLHHLFTSPLVQQWWLKRRGLGGMRMTCTEYRYMKYSLLKKWNYEGFTPLALSTSRGCTAMCNTILQTNDVYKFPQWKVGPTTFSYYDVSEIDPSVTDFGRPCIMDLFLYGPDYKCLDFCDVPVIKELLRKKWDCYRWIFYPWFLFHLILMILLTTSSEKRLHLSSLSTVSNLNDSAEKVNATMEPAAKPNVPFLLPEEYIILIAASLYLFVDLFDTLRTLFHFLRSWSKLSKFRSSLPSFMKDPVLWRPDVFRNILLLFSVSYLMAIFLRVANSPREVIATSLACVLGWIFMLSFTRAIKSIGIFTVMLQRMLFSDLLHFFVVFMVILIGFSSAFRLLFLDPKSTNTQSYPEEIADLKITIFNFWRVVCGLNELDIFEYATYPSQVKILFLGFVLIANILLLNMLIAAMSDTYAAITTQKPNLWLKIRGKSVSLIEQHLPTCFQPRLKLEHRERFDDQGRRIDLWLLPVEEIGYAHYL